MVKPERLGGLPIGTPITFDFQYHDGAVLGAVRVHAVFLSLTAGDAGNTWPRWDSDPSVPAGVPAPDVGDYVDMMRDLLDSSYMDELAAEYNAPGVPAISRGSLAGAHLVSAELASGDRISSSPLRYGLSDPRIRGILTSLIGATSDPGVAGAVPAPDGADDLYVVFLRATGAVRVTDPAGLIASGPDRAAGAWHGSQLLGGGPRMLHYAVIPEADQTRNSFVVHEIAEVVTNPERAGWYDNRTGSEICDAGDKIQGPCWFERDQEPVFHWYTIAPFWHRSTRRCAAPPDDGAGARPVLDAVIGVKSGATCISKRLVGGEHATLSAFVGYGSSAEPVAAHQWYVNGTLLATAPECDISVPASGTLSVALIAWSALGIRVSASTTFAIVSAAEAQSEEALCRALRSYRALVGENSAAVMKWLQHPLGPDPGPLDLRARARGAQALSRQAAQLAALLSQAARHQDRGG